MAEFFCGVIEGFYSRPWSEGQRVDLFAKMQRFGLNAYLYAPKDDAKHRNLWREPYTDVEVSGLEKLIKACDNNGVTFFYGISPGVDMRYSKSAELDLLQAKLDQVKAIGCRGFAILWDDIDTTLPVGDRHAFKSLAEAHVTITNTLHNYLDRPPFMLCPVEYCSSRADPTLRKSDYLRTIGNGLDKEIGVFWTGSKVVSQTICVAEIIEVADVLKRKPVIWDNIHANDYDQQRMFLGPFSGRSTGLVPHLAGVMTNPNCEYSFNVPALYSLGSWFRNPEAYDSMKAARLSIAHFIEETRRKTSSSGDDCPADTTKDRAENIPKDGAKEEAGEDNDEDMNSLTESDVEWLFHLFWLPHCHGPKAQLLLDEFDYLRRHAHLVKAIDEDNDFMLEWITRASHFNASCKHIFRMLDKWSYVENRQLFFDINPYLNNLQVILRACNRYLKWVGVDRCARPISGGPTLAGLVGGFTGDLGRLYPVQSKTEFPVRNVHQPEVLVVRPLLARDVPAARAMAKAGAESIAARIVDQADCSGYVLAGKGDTMSAFVVGTRQVSAALAKADVKKATLKKAGHVSGICVREGRLYYTSALARMVESHVEFNAANEDLALFVLPNKEDDLASGWLPSCLPNIRKAEETKDIVVMQVEAK